jgi:hypothetical protein
MMRWIYLLVAFFSFGFESLFAQDLSGGGIPIGKVTGVFQIDAVGYLKDTLIRTPVTEDKLRMNAYGLIQYNNGPFTAGIRYEAYLPTPLLGIDPQYKGSGIANRFLSFNTKKVSVTVGNFYEQFGFGMTLRAWWQPLLGYDNSIDGVRLQVNPYRGVQVKTVFGRQRLFWNPSEGVVRGADVDLDLNQILDTLWKSPLQVNFGGSFVSRFQPIKEQPFDQYIYKIPQNVGCWSARTSIIYKKWFLKGEFAYKFNDPTGVNQRIYRHGEGLYIATGYSKKGFGLNLEAKRIVNMDYRSEINQTGQNVQVNFIPPIAKQHTYRLPTLYIYATQPLGEMGIQADVFYKFKKGSLLGGKYGTTVNLNYARIHAPETVIRTDDIGYDAPFFGVGKRLYYSDFNVEVQKKLSDKWKMNLMYIHIDYDKDVILGLQGYGMIQVNAAIADFTLQINEKHSLRMEGQWMKAAQPNEHKVKDFGDWAMLMLEYNISPHWSFVLWDEYNYGNPDISRRLHYYSGMIVYVIESTRISFSYGRMREGLNCAGGVCRPIPAMNGFFLSVSSTF